jgi:hypothetical protein
MEHAKDLRLVAETVYREKYGPLEA